MSLQTQPGPQLVPSQTKTQLPSNYINLYDFTSQYLPNTSSELAAIYGNQSIAGMLSYHGAESSFDADKVIWSEEGRLHTNYTDVTRSGSTFTKENHVFRVNEVVNLSDSTTQLQGIITSVPDSDSFVVAARKNAGFGTLGTSGITAWVAFSEFRKGTDGMQGSLEKEVSILSNKPIITKDKYEVSGSDVTNVGWINPFGTGWYWYRISEEDTKRRFEDRAEMACLLGETSEAGSAADNAGLGGTEGLFEAIRKRGNIYQGIASDISEWDTILKRFDKQGKIQDNLFYCDRDQSLAIDNMLGELNAGYSNGISYGIFDNSEEMSVNLGFRGFKRGSYNFFKTDYDLLNDITLMGSVAAAANKVRGILIPVGTKEVYDGSGTYGRKHKKPFLEMKYRSAGAENRKYKTWVTGSVGGVFTNSVDSMQVHELSEKMLCTTGANNFMLFEGA
jgi:hypothetical protein